MHSVAQPGAPAYSTRPPLVSPPSSIDPSHGRAPASTAAYTAQSALSSSASARQLPPGAAYASDHAQQHRVNSSFPSPSSAPPPAGFPSSISTAPRDARQGWQRQDGASVMQPQQTGPVYGTGGDSGVMLPSDSVVRGGENLRSGFPDFSAGRPRPTPEAADGTTGGEPAAPNWSISLQEPTPPPSQHFAASSIDARQASPRSPSSIARPSDVNFSRPQPVTLAHSNADEAASSSVVGTASPGGPAPQRPRMVDRHSFAGIPGGRLPSSPSTRAAVDATEAQSRIPSFSPAAAFSPQDRGPYPPHAVSPTRVRQETVVDHEVLADRAQAYSPVMSGAPELPPTDLGRPGSLAFDTSAFPSDLAGIGRNSVIRAAASPPLFTATSSPIELGGPSTSNPASAARSPQLVNPSPQALAAAQQAAQTSPAAVAYTFPTPNQNINASFSLPTPPPHLVPQPEICVECMMRDRDMADVDVTTPGVWERASDADFEEQMRWEAETTPDPVASNGGAGTPAASSSWSGEHTGSLESAAGPSSKRRESSAAYSRESLGGRSSLAHGMGGSSLYKGRKRLGRGQILTSGNLKVWTTMNPPAAAHRWRTLQTYLATQAHYLELDRQSRDAETSQSQSLPVRLSQHTARTSQGSRSRSSSMLSPAAVAAEKAAMEQEERSRRAKGKGRNPSRGTLADETNRLSSASLLPPPIGMAPMMPAPPRRPNVMASSGASMRSYSSGDQPWLGNQLRRISTANRDLPPANASFDSSRSHRFTFSPFSRSAVDLRGVPSPRSVSPARTNDDRRTSMWSRFRRSGSPSVFSYAPSGSMLDMHLGLSQDKHMPYATYPAYETYPSRSDPAVARHAETARREEALAASQATGISGETSGGKKKRKGIKGFFNKLVGGGGGTKKPMQTSVSAPPTPGAEAAYEESYDDSELAPPPPLSALVNEPRYHQRSASNSSVDSFGPATPPVPGGLSFRSNGPMGYESGSLRTPADRQSVLTMGSLNSTRSRPIPANGHDSLRNGTSWPSADSLRDPAGLDTGGEHEVLAGDEDSAGEYGSPKPQAQKSLPLLPSENAYAYRPPMDTYGDPNMPLVPPNAPYAHYTASRSAYSLDPAASQSNFIEEFGYDGRPGNGGGARDRSATVTLDGQTIRKARSRSKIFSMSFGKKSKQENIPPPLPHPNMRAHSLDSGVALGQGAGSPYREGVADAGYM